MATEQLVNGGSSTLTSSLDGSANPITVNVANAASFPSVPQFRLLIDSEIFLCTAVAGTAFTCSRAQEGTSLATHANGSTVSFTLTKQGLLNVITQNSGGSTGYGPVFGPFTPPTISTFPTWLNQGVATFDSTFPTIGCLRDTSNNGSTNNVRALLQTAPATPWTMTLVFFFNLPSGCNGNAGICLRDSSSGRFKTYNVGNITTAPDNVYLYNWSNVTTVNTTPGNATYTFSRGLRMMQVTNDGTTLTYNLSQDFVHWNFFYSELVSGNYVANINQVGFAQNFVSQQNTAQSCDMSVYHAFCG